MGTAEQSAYLTDAEFREKYMPLIDAFVAWRTRLNVAFDLPACGSMEHAVQAAVDASRGSERLRGEDWENACHEVIWKADPALFDRIRENNAKMKGRDVETIVNLSLNETLSRTILTVAVTSLVVLSLMFLGGGVLADFGFALFVGFVVGTFSSISISAPLYIYLRRKFDPTL